MNSVLMILVVLGVLILWIMLSPLFGSIGGILLNIFGNVKNNIKKEEEKKDEN